jgi:4-diphosphocytidyl-2-C-methyl-D-erythritol kinase
MNSEKLKSWAKINLSLHVIKRQPNNYHNIESLITFAQIYDEIKIKRISKEENKIFFLGKFSKGIGKNNTITKLLNLLEKDKLVKNKKFEIKIKKNIPQKSGMGGGSMNAACILKYLIKKKIVKITNKKAIELACKIGSDVVLGLEKKNSILFKNGKVRRLNNKVNFHVLIVMPKFGCSTKNIFAEVRKFSKPLYFNTNKSFFRTKNLVQSNNDLENIVFKKYSKIKYLKNFISSLPQVVFTRMTGTGSALVAYFKSKKTAKNAAKIFKRKYKGHWYIVSKTI